MATVVATSGSFAETSAAFGFSRTAAVAVAAPATAEPVAERLGRTAAAFPARPQSSQRVITSKTTTASTDPSSRRDKAADEGRTSGRYSYRTGIRGTGVGFSTALSFSFSSAPMTMSNSAMQASAETESGPVLEAGAVNAVTETGALSAANGVTVLGEDAFVADGYRIVRINKSTGVVTLLAGSATQSGCTDAASGSAARFTSKPLDWGSPLPPKVVGTDGTLIYVTDGCGLRSIHASTGATSTLTSTYYNQVAVIGNTLYGYIDARWPSIDRYDLVTGTVHTLTSQVTYGGVMAGDENYLWLVSNSTLYRIDRITGNVTTVTNSLNASPTALLSVGGYLYLTARPYNAPYDGALALMRVSKTDGARRLIAGGGAGSGDLFYFPTGIATDGTKLYLADSGSRGTWLKSVSATSARSFSPAAAAPVLEAGAVNAVTETGALSAANGVTVLGEDAFVADGYRIVRINKSTGVVTLLAGSATQSGCTDAASGSAARFTSKPLDWGSPLPPKVVGTDGTLIYVTDGCGLRSIHASTGVTSTLTSTYYNQVAVIGNTLYGYIDARWPSIDRYDLVTGTFRTLTYSAPSGRVMAGDENYLWLVSNSTLYRIDRATGGSTTITTSLPSLPFTGALLAGDYLYGAAQYWESGISYYQVYRISKTGAVTLVHTGRLLGLINGLATDGSRLYLTDSTKRLLSIRKTKLPTYEGGPSLPGETTGGNNPTIGAPDSPEAAACNACHGDPIQTDTGALLEPVTDLRVSDQARALEMSRTYSSAAASTRSVLGYGWAWPYGMTVTEPVTGQVLVRQENGSVVAFARQADGSFKAAPRVQASLVKNSDGTWTFTRQRWQVMVFNTAGKIIKQTDRSGQALTYAYNTAGQLSAVTGASGRALRFTYDNAGYLATAAAPSGAKVVYEHNAAGDLTAVTDPTGATTRYAYNDQHLLTTMTSARGAVTANTYDAAGRVIKQVDPEGRIWRFAYVDGDALGTSTVTITAPDGVKTVESYVDGQLRAQTKAAGTSEAATTSYTYDPLTSQISSITNALGHTTRFTYLPSGERATMTDPVGATSTWRYNEVGDLVEFVDAAGNATRYGYDARGNRTHVTSPEGRSQTFTYNANGTLASATTAAGYRTTFTYNTDGDLISVTGPGGQTTTSAHDADGRVTATTDTNRQTTTYTLDGLGRITATTDPEDNTTAFVYNADGHRTKLTDAAAHTTTTTFNLAGELVSVTDAAGNRTTSTYTDAALPATITDAAGNVTTYTYDKRGNRTGVTDALQRTTTYTYDAANRLTAITLPSGARTSTAYDAAGRPTSSTDARGKTTTYTYDAAGRLAASTDPNKRTTTRAYDRDGLLTAVTGPDGKTTRSDYNADGQLLAVTDADGATTRYSYDPVSGKKTSRTLPGGAITRYSYDAAGRDQITTQSDGSTITRTYTPRGQLKHIDYSDPATADVTFTYDALGRMTTMTDGTGTTRHTYDALGRRITSVNGAGAEVGYHYNALGQLEALTYPGGKTVIYTYDAAGQMSAATDWQQRTTRFAWTADGQQRTRTTPNDVATTTDYNQVGQPVDITITHDQAVLGRYTYRYDDAAQLSGDATGGDARSYTYSPTGQLESVATTTGTSSFADGSYATTSAGLLTGLPNGATLSYNDARQLARLTEAAGAVTDYTYDQRGNRARATTTSSSDPAVSSSVSYRYTSANHLAGATTAEGTSVDYTADATGLRQSRTTATGTETFLWATTGAMPLLLDDGTHTYLYGPDLAPYAQINRDGGIEYLHADNLGSTRLITTTDGAAAATITYDPYGKRTAHTGTADSRIGYTGNWTDPATGLVYLRARDYDPATGQFLTIDPLIDATGQLYAYVGNNPLQLTDPTGLCEDCNLFEKLVLMGPSTQDLTTGFTGDALGFFNGAIDDVTFGFTAYARKKINPGYACTTTANSWYDKGGAASTIAEMITPVRAGARAVVSVARNAREIWNNIRNWSKRLDFADDTGAIRLGGGGSARTARNTVPGGLKNLDHDVYMTTDDALDTAIEFLGSGYRDMGGGRFLSKDGLRQVRMTDGDLAHRRQDPHINFEIYNQPIGPGMRGGPPRENFHVYLPEESGWHLR
ncbi:hypothetical protein HS041_29615 [Planomonospora sp. ID67723]|uniref:RHS repeat-associated core domain-containing protein n=1 Tax=Planomonospora sp. ID67723 TaxID=2738134 RepID=UPI0018C38E9C|nr:RHS repeat-associated core domain-containing protein [Planomonospora sp. ID67723]MBG0831872.1 hypothetical protein [Planomonospora sp. ID67723]